MYARANLQELSVPQIRHSQPVYTVCAYYDQFLERKHQPIYQQIAVQMDFVQSGLLTPQDHAIATVIVLLVSSMTRHHITH